MGQNSVEVAYGFGQMGSVFTNAATQVVAPTDRVIVAIQFLADTTFDELSPESGTAGICVGDAAGEKGAGAEVAITGATNGNVGARGGQIINAAADSNLTVFPKGAMIFGRWDSFTIDVNADGGVIAYLGY